MVALPPEIRRAGGGGRGAPPPSCVPTWSASWAIPAPPPSRPIGQERSGRPLLDTLLVRLDHQASISPTEVNLLSEQVLRDRALALMAHKDSKDLPVLPALAGIVTNLLLDRVTRIVWTLSQAQLNEWSNQRALSRVVASISGVRLPERADAEQPGSRMLKYVGRYRERRKKLMKADKATIRRAQQAGRPFPATRSANDSLVELDETLYHCRYGCTPPVVSYRRAAPGDRAQPWVEFELCSFAKENLQLHRDNINLRRLETEAVQMLERKLDNSRTDLANSVATEHDALVILHKQRDRTREVLDEVQNLASALTSAEKDRRGIQEALRKKEADILVLRSKVARAHLDLAGEQRANQQTKRKLEATCEKQRQADRDRVENLESHNARFFEPVEGIVGRRLLSGFSPGP